MNGTSYRKGYSMQMRVMDGFFNVNGRKAYVLADACIKIVDDSFSHEFGICHVAHEEVDNFNILECYYMDDESPVYPICKCIKEDIMQTLQDQLN